MSANNSIIAFIDVIESELISLPDWEELSQWASFLPDDEEEISHAIDTWLKTEYRSEILALYRQKLAILAATSEIDWNIKIGAFRSKYSNPNHNQPSQPAKELLINSIQLNSPLSKNKDSSVKP